MYAGLAGVLLALAFGRIVPDTFGFVLSIDFLAMIVIGGLGSVGGRRRRRGASSPRCRWCSATTATRCRSWLDPASPAVGAAEAARLLYGAAVIAVLLFAPGGLAPAPRRSSRRHPLRTRPPKETSHESTRSLALAAVLLPGAWPRAARPTVRRPERPGGVKTGPA